MKDVYSQLLNELNKFDFIMLNENSKFSSICGLEGEWSDLIKLIMERKVFLTKIIDGKTTLLSSRLYFALQSLPSNFTDLGDYEKLVYEFLKINGPSNISVLKTMLPIKKNEINKVIQKLQNMLYITAIAEDQRLTSSWGTYVYGTAMDWEVKLNEKEMHENPIELITETFRNVMSIEKLEKITRKRIKSGN